MGIASIISVWIWPASEVAGNYTKGNIVCATASFVTTAIVIGLRINYGGLNKKGALDAAGVQPY